MEGMIAAAMNEIYFRLQQPVLTAINKNIRYSF